VRRSTSDSPIASDTLVEVPLPDDVQDGVPVGVKVRGRELMIVRWRGEFFALRNICAHMAAMLTGGWIQSEVVQGESFFDIDVEEGSPIVRCPWHGFRYRLRDGACTVDPKLRVRSYDVVVRDDKLFVDIGRP
jgi:nitrite reductase/ring-hydroxylating ferredoxin subunit